MQKICRQCTKQFEIQQSDLKFYEKISPVFNKKKFSIPPPTLCPVCRKQGRLAFRNERKLYLRKCDACQKEIVSTFSTDKPNTVFCSSCWWSDIWDAKNYGRDFDFTKPFFEQFKTLLQSVPLLALISDSKAIANNCSYINYAGDSKNCYRVFDSDFNEDSYYSNVLKYSKNCVDCSYVQNSENCYECIDCSGCYNLFYSQNCVQCHDGYFLNDCVSCDHCILCNNLVQKKYHILNKPYTKEAYEKTIEKMMLDSTNSLIKFFKKNKEQTISYPHKYMHSVRTENCSGDYIFNSKNCHECYNISDSQDLKWCDSIFRSTDCLDVSSFGEKIQMVLNSETVGVNCFDILFSVVVYKNCSGIRYSFSTHSSKNCFGCVSIHKKEYCILNKPYAKQAYEKMLAKIVAHMIETKEWGEFFPISISPYGYNETIAQEYISLDNKDALAIGAPWKEMDIEQGHYFGAISDIPDTISKTQDSITKIILTCKACQYHYKITPQEFLFYKKNKIPIPHICPDCRHKSRRQKRNEQHLFSRKCQKCNAEIQTTYAPKRPEIVYCEACYLKEVY